MKEQAENLKLRILLHNERAQNRLLVRLEEDRQTKIQADALSMEKVNIEHRLKTLNQEINWDTLEITDLPKPEVDEDVKQPIRNRRSTSKRS